MSKKIKQMEIDSLRKTFQDVRDLVVLSITGVDATADNQMRLTLRKKNIQMQVIKNSLTRRVFDEMGMKVTGYWTGPTTLAWGSNSLAELSREIGGFLKKNPKLKAKGAVSEGQEVSFEQALKMPTKPEAIGRVVALALAPAQRIASQLLGPVQRVASQIKTLSEKVTESEKAPEEGAAPAAAS